MVKYSHNQNDEEEYIDLIPILEKLSYDAQEFLAPIKKVRIHSEKRGETAMKEENFFKGALRQASST